MSITLSKQKLLYLALLLTLFALSACEVNRLRSIEEHYRQKRYAAAIQETDEFIPKAANGAFVTRAELTRSSAYHQLALLSLERNNSELALQFFKLANSEAANKDLAALYKQRIMDAALKDDYETQLLNVNNILREIPHSALEPEMMYRRINLYLDWRGDVDGAWQDYMNLYEAYAGDSYEVAARKSMERIVPNKKAYGLRLAKSGYYNEALAIFFELAKYPVIELNEINRLIGSTYRDQAEVYLRTENYLEADRFLRIAVQYIPDQREQIESQLRQVVDLFISKGDQFLAARDFDSALTHYQKAFEIISDYPPALEAINKLNKTIENINRAAQLFAQAERSEASGKYPEALRLFQEANALDSNPQTQKHISIIQNIMEADKDAQAFTRKIINQHRGGILITRINNQKQELAKQYKANEIRDSGWKYLLSTSQYKYEVRYDLITPRDTFFYVWQVNLRDRSIIPLNKISEELMK